jgi:hypothetical protein
MSRAEWWLMGLLVWTVISLQVVTLMAVLHD